MAKKPPSQSETGGTGLTVRPHVEGSLGPFAAAEMAGGGTPFPAGSLNAVISDILSRVVRLETHFGYVRKDVDDFKESQREMQATLSEMRDGIRELPTKTDLWTWRTQWIIIGVTTAALIVVSIIGGLAWLKPEPSSPQPIIIQVPSSGATTTTPTPVPTKPQR